MKKLAIINGPNLNLLGTRETDIYGNMRFEDFLDQLRSKFPSLSIEYFQSNIEGELIDAVQKFGRNGYSIILNAAGYSHTSVALADSIAAVDCRVVEVHISNIYKREDYRHVSLTASKCIGVISGLGLEGYELAARFLFPD
jgi:3-dehydroquinate dehydratase II